MVLPDFEKLGVFYLGQKLDFKEAASSAFELLPSSPLEPVLYQAKDLTTHAVCLGMTGSGKTGLCLALLEEALIDGIPVIAIDPKGDIANLALTFPDLCPEHLEPWLSEEEARGQGLSLAEFARTEARRKKEELEASGQDLARIARLKNAGAVSIFTPGSTAGLPVSILSGLSCPSPALLEAQEALRDKINGVTRAIFALLGQEKVSLQSREFVLVAKIFADAWQAGLDLSLVELVRQVQKPAFTFVGALDLEAFFPLKERMELAMSLNNLLASQGFEMWLSGAPLETQNFLYDENGRPRISIFSLSHLSQQERMFFVSLLLNEVVSWLSSQAGSSSLRAILYMDEITGYFPPVANPPSKPPLMTLLKQARAYGLGLLLASQNPVDLDYKGLANAGTWFIGRLQTAQDKARLMDGLATIAGEGGAFDAQFLEKALSSLSARVFLLKNAHSKELTFFKTRPTLSYLAGPLIRAQLKALLGPAKGRATVKANSLGAGEALNNSSKVSRRFKEIGDTQPIVPADIPVYFLPQEVACFSRELEGVYRPCLLAVACVFYSDSKLAVEVNQQKALLLPVDSRTRVLDFGGAKSVKLDFNRLSDKPLEPFSFLEPPALLLSGDNYKGWAREYTAHICRNQPLYLLKSRLLNEVSLVNESQRDFRVRLGAKAREARDLALGQLGQKYDPKLAALEERIRLATYKAQVEAGDVKRQQIDSACAVGATVLGAFLGRKTFSVSTLNRASSAARSANRLRKQEEQAQLAQENLEVLNAKLQELNSQFEAEATLLANKFDLTNEEFEVFAIKATQANVSVKVVALAWVAS
jgi:hypothetical protein